MSAEEMKEAIQTELGDTSVETEAPDDIEQSEGDAQSEDDSPQFTEAEQSAYAKGWRPKDDFEGNPDDWRSAKQFNEIGGLIGRVKQQSEQMRTMQKGFDERLTNVNTMHKAQLETQMTQLNSQFKDAVEDGDTAKAGEIRDQQVSINRQIDVASAPAPQAANNDNQHKLEWELANPWINTNSDKANVAKGTYSSAIALGKSIPEAIAMAEQSVVPYDKPASNPNRAAPASVSSGQQTSRKGKERSLSMADVSHEEGQMRGMFKDDKSFLKAVQDSRVGA